MTNTPLNQTGTAVYNVTWTSAWTVCQNLCRAWRDKISSSCTPKFKICTWFWRIRLKSGWVKWAVVLNGTIICLIDAY